MKTFKDYIEESKDSFEHHLGKLNKTAKSIASHVSRGGGPLTSRGYELRSRYTQHLEAIKEKHPEKWKEHCKANGIYPNHDAMDMYA
jgi:hypothetical protein